MPDITVTADDVDRLAAKLDQIGEQLDSDEKALLLAVFQVAGEQIAEHTAAAGEEVAGFAMGGMRPFSLNYASLPAGALGQGFKGSFVNSRTAAKINPGVNMAGDTIGIGVGVRW